MVSRFPLRAPPVKSHLLCFVRKEKKKNPLHLRKEDARELVVLWFHLHIAVHLYVHFTSSLFQTVVAVHLEWHECCHTIRIFFSKAKYIELINMLPVVVLWFCKKKKIYMPKTLLLEALQRNIVGWGPSVTTPSVQMEPVRDFPLSSSAHSSVFSFFFHWFFFSLGILL